jgi:hypothetical protein
MDPATLALLLQLITLAGKLAPVVIQQIEAIKQAQGKSADEIFAEAGIVFKENDATALRILAGLIPTE